MDKNTYRGKRVDNGEWVYGCFYESKISGCYILVPKIDTRKKKDGSVIIRDTFDAVEVIPETVGQCTGMVSRNGEPIFEGDIVKMRLIGGVYGGFEWPAAAVSFEAGNFGVTLRDEFIPLGSFKSNVKIEIIGNIFDNEELLEG